MYLPFNFIPFEINHVLNLCLLFSTISVLVVCLENLYTWQSLKKSGILDGVGIMSQKKTDLIYSHQVSLFILILKTCISLYLIFDIMIYAHYSVIALILMSLSFFYSFKKNANGNDGSDQLNYLIFFVISLASLINTKHADLSAIFFIATQSILSYVIAGISKLCGKDWRNGSALPKIIRTRIYGAYSLYLIFNRFKRFSVYACKYTILWECLFFLVLYPPLTMIFLLNALIFHLLNGLIMGLNHFTFSFVATYPAILFTVQFIWGSSYVC